MCYKCGKSTKSNQILSWFVTMGSFYRSMTIFSLLYRAFLHCKHKSAYEEELFLFQDVKEIDCLVNEASLAALPIKLITQY